MKFLFVAFAPIPATFLISAIGASVTLDSHGGDATPILIIFALGALSCCVVGTIGMCGGFDKPAGPLRAIGATTLGFLLFALEVAIVSAGCNFIIA